MESWIHEKLIKEIGQKRYNHSLGVMETSIALAKRYNSDMEKAKIAGLLHDCGKYMDNTYLLKRIGDFDIIQDDVMKLSIELNHGPLGAILAEKEYYIYDSEIHNAIYFHTTGKEDMSLLEKIVYLADYIEPNRNFPGVQLVRDLAFINLERSILLAMEQSLLFLISNKKLIHLNTIKARNYLVSSEKME